VSQIFFVRGCVNCVHTLGERKKKFSSATLGFRLACVPTLLAITEYGVMLRIDCDLTYMSIPCRRFCHRFATPATATWIPQNAEAKGLFSSGAGCQLKRPKRLKTAARDLSRLTRCRIHVMCKSGHSRAEQSRWSSMRWAQPLPK
jgi:hypothetical protein